MDNSRRYHQGKGAIEYLTISDFTLKRYTYRAVHGVDLDFRICKVVTLRDHHYGLSKIKLKLKHHGTFAIFFLPKEGQLSPQTNISLKRRHVPHKAVCFMW